MLRYVGRAMGTVASRPSALTEACDSCWETTYKDMLNPDFTLGGISSGADFAHLTKFGAQVSEAAD